jgi:hypothetical protein
MDACIENWMPVSICRCRGNPYNIIFGVMEELMPAEITTGQVWTELEREIFAVVGMVTARMSPGRLESSISSITVHFSLPLTPQRGKPSSCEITQPLLKDLEGAEEVPPLSFFKQAVSG